MLPSTRWSPRGRRVRIHAYITNAAFFQAADELRTLHWIAYRAKSLSLTHGTQLANNDEARDIWENDPAWQPARETLERLLLAYDWGEAFTALDLVVKPAFDALFKQAFVDLATAHQDGLTAQLLQESRVDTTRNQAWAGALARDASADHPDTRDTIARGEDRWRPLAERAVEGLTAVFATAPNPADPSRVRATVDRSTSTFRTTWTD